MTAQPKLLDIEGSAMWTERRCPSCESVGMSVFYEVRNVPVHSVLLLPTREEALNYPKGDIVLGACLTCGFISNLAFEASLHEYSSSYEETQGFSPTFNTFHHRLATCLIEKYNLYDKDIIEIGCGKGEFLILLCELGGNRGVGFDPAYVYERNRSAVQHHITFVQDFYSEKYATYDGDFICCKMTLEHIQHTADFVRSVRQSIRDQHETIIFFQLPDVTRILRELAFWDIYYEHCSYFSLGSLARLFRHCSFEIIDLSKDYGDQYLMLEARPSPEQGNLLLPQEADLDVLAGDVASFARNYRQKLETWLRNLRQMRRDGLRTVIWGAGSKGVAFLTTLKIRDEIAYAVDINPYKHGTYMAGTGHEIVGPAFLREYQPDVVIVMNPIYREDIRQDLNRLGLTPELITV